MKWGFLPPVLVGTAFALGLPLVLHCVIHLQPGCKSVHLCPYEPLGLLVKTVAYWLAPCFISFFWENKVYG